MTYELEVEGKKVTYDDKSDKVYLNGSLTYSMKPVFIPNGESEPTFFGISSGGKVYDIYGNVSDIVDSDKIKL